METIGELRKTGLISPYIFAGLDNNNAFRPMTNEESNQNLFTKLIAKAALYFNCTEKDILGRSRKSHLVNARQSIMYCMSTRSTASLTWIGRKMNRDHSTVLYSKDEIYKAAECSKLFKTEDDRLSFILKLENETGQRFLWVN